MNRKTGTSRRTRTFRKPPKIIWDLDAHTLRLAWLRYHDTPMAERTEPFGKWFADRHYIQGLISWPWLEEETANVRVYRTLLEMCK